MNDRIRVAVVGLGAIARAVHLPILRRRSDLFDVVGVCDLSPDAVDVIGERFGISVERRYTDLDDMLDNAAADALLVLTSGSHGDTALRALERGIAVLCEKPLATTRREADALAAAAGDRRDRLMLAYMKLYDPAVRRAAQLVANGPPLRAADVTVLHPSAAAQLATSELGPEVFHVPAAAADALQAAQAELEVEALGRAAAATLGSLYSQVVLGSIVHDLAVLRALGVRIAAIEHADRWPGHAVPASVHVSGHSPEGVRVTIGWHYLHDYPAYREQVRCHHERGSVELEFPSPYLLRAPTVLEHVTSSEQGAGRWSFASYVEAFEEQLLAFHRMVTRGVAPAAGIAEGREDIITCQRIVAAIARREGIEVGGEAARDGDSSTARGDGVTAARGG